MITILLLSGVAEHLGGMSKFSLNDVDVKVEGNRTVIVTKIWPSTMEQIEKRKEFWLRRESGKQKIEFYHPMIQGFIHFVERTKHKSTDLAPSFIKSNLPIEVKPDFEEEILEWEGTGQRVLFLTFHGPEREFNRSGKRGLVTRIRASTVQMQKK